MSVQTAFADDSVNHIQRVVAFADGVSTADADFHASPGDAAVLNMNATDTPLKSVCNLGYRLVLEIFVVQHGYGTGHIRFSYSTIANNNHLVKDFGIFLQNDV